MRDEKNPVVVNGDNSVREFGQVKIERGGGYDGKDSTIHATMQESAKIIPTPGDEPPHQSEAETTIDERTAKLLELFKQSIIDPTIHIEKPPDCLLINNSVIGTLGNFSMVIGKAKSRKTFLITAALAAAIQELSILNFTGTLPANQSNVIYFDTEQSKYHAHKTVKRVCELAGIPMPTNLMASGLRKYTPADRLAIIEAAIYNTPELGFVVIDGVRDLVSSINDEEQATILSSCLLRWTEELNIHIIVLLHQNKTDQNARGHLGTELQNKAETVLSVTKDTKNKEISIVEAEFCRDKEPDPFAFEIVDGLPKLSDDWQVKTSKAGNAKQVTPDEIHTDTHIKVLRSVFQIEPKPLRAALQNSIVNQFKTQFDLKFGINKAVQFVTYYVSVGLLTVNESSKTSERYYIFNDNQEVMNNDTPF